MPAGLWAQNGLTFSKAFGTNHIPLNGSTTLSFTITNISVGYKGYIHFNDDLPAGLVVSTPNGLSGDCNGVPLAVAGSGSVSLGEDVAINAGHLDGGDSCTFSVNVTGIATGLQTNLTDPLNCDCIPATGGTATDTLTVDAAIPPTISKSFGAASIPLNGSTSLSFTITNPDPIASLTGVAFTDTLPAGLVIATPNGLTGSCGGGTITATDGSGSASLAGATLAAFASCTFSVNVTGITAGTKNNSTTVTSNEGGTGNTATASVTVNVPNPPTIGKSFGSASIVVGASTSLSFTITNPNAGAALDGVGFSDTLPAGLVVATPNGLSGTCGGGAIIAAAGTGSVSLTAGTLAAGASCAFSVNVTGATAGTKNNTTSAVGSTESGAGSTASASVTVITLNPPTIGKAFGAPNIPVGGSTSLSFTITNPNTGASLSGVAFTDTLPAGLVIATPYGLTGTCGSGTITATAGSGSVSLAAGTLAASASCTFSVNVTGTTSGTKNNTTGTVSSTEGGTGTTASASVTVAAIVPPTISEVFGAANILVGASTSLSFTVTNPNPSASLSGVAFTDTLPAGLVVATPNGLTGTCGGGAITATAGSGSASLAGAALAANASCTFSVTVTGTASGAKNNTTGAVGSTEGGTGNTASASVTVAAVSPPTISKSFGAANFVVGGSTSLSFTITNPNPGASLSGVAFTDTLPAGVVIATPNGLSGTCGSGTITATAGSGSASLAGGTLAAAASCTFSVKVTGTTAGTKNNTTGAVSSTEGGAGNTASASVVAQPPAAIPVLSPGALAGLALLLAGLGWALPWLRVQRSRPNV